MRRPLLAHPAFTGAVAVLAVNDHVLKGRAPAPLTGKLSDVAGVFVIAVAGAALTRRPRWATAFTGVGFVALKTSPAVAWLAAPLLGGTTRTDATDLVALASLYPAFRLASGHLRPTPTGEHPVAHQAAAVAAAGVAVLAVSATSCLEPAVVDAFAVQDGRAFARISGQLTLWAVSDDGGVSWREAPSGPSAVPASEACSPSLGCFRVDGESVDHARPGRPFATAFAFTPEQQRRMQQRAEQECGLAVRDMFAAVAVVPRADGDHVVVAMGTQGVLHRSPQGRWTREAVLDRRPLPLHGPSRLRLLSLAPFAVALLSPLALVLGWRRRARRVGVVGFLVALAGAVALMAFAFGLLLFGLDYVVAGPLIAGLSVAVFVVSVAIAARGPVEAGSID